MRPERAAVTAGVVPHDLQRSAPVMEVMLSGHVIGTPTIAIILVICGILPVVSCNYSGTAVQAEVPEEPDTVVAVAKAGREDLGQQLELSAEFRPYREIDLHAKVAGYLKEIRVDIGDKVEEGELIASLEIPEFTSDLAGAAASRKSSENEVRQARSEVERTKAMMDAARLVYNRLASVAESRPKLLARQEVDDALAKLEVAEAQYDRARAGLTVAEEQVSVQNANEARARTMAEYTVIRAPFSGVITARYADEGAMIQAGTSSEAAIVRLTEVSHLRLTLYVPESAIPNISTGHLLKVRVPVLARAFEGRISRYSNRVNSSTRTMETEVDVANPDLILKPGMYAFVDLPLTVRTAALTVPVQAVFREGERATVMVVNQENRLEEREVSLGIQTPEKTEITSGIRENDLVIVGSRSHFQPGQKVTPKEIPVQSGAEGS